MLLGPDVGVEEMTLESPMLALAIPVGVTLISIFSLIPTLLKVLGLLYHLNLNPPLFYGNLLFSLDQDSGSQP